MKRFRAENVSHQQGAGHKGKKRRTVAELLAAAENITAEKEREEAERHAAEEARRKKEQAAARTKHLKQLEGQETKLWQRVDDLVQTSKPKAYDLATTLLTDLRDFAAQAGQTGAFKSKLGHLRGRYSTRSSFQQRLMRAGLGDTQQNASMS